MKGVDVNHDGKPDIGMDGRVLKDAPIATTRDGIKGVDVDGDGKPDIALRGGQHVPLSARLRATPDMRLPDMPDVVAPPPPSNQPAVPVNSAVAPASNMLGVPVNGPAGRYGDPATTLTSVGTLTPAIADTGTPLGAPPASSAPPGAPPVAPMVGPGASPAAAYVPPPPALVEDAWADDGPAGSVLGRPT